MITMRTNGVFFFIMTAVGLFLLAGCFSPDYGEGNFTCEKGECPKGYQCVPEGQRKVCRKTAQQLDAKQPGKDARVDGAIEKDGPLEDVPGKDIPGEDGPISEDGAGVDAPLSDGPVLDQPPTDGPGPDQHFTEGSVTDLPAGDLTLPDQYVPIPDQNLSPDLYVPLLDLYVPPPDLYIPPPDQYIPPPDLPVVIPDLPIIPDTLVPDAYPHPVCTGSQLVGSSLRDNKEAYDLTADTKNKPHFSYVNTSGTVYWGFQTSNSWSGTKVGAADATQTSIAAALQGIDEYIHIVYRYYNTTTVGVHHTYSMIGSASWTTPQTISSWIDVNSLDIDARKEWIYFGASGQVLFGGTPPTPGPITMLYRLDWDAGNSKYKYTFLNNYQSDIFLDTRVGVGDSFMGHSISRQYLTNPRYWGILNRPHGGSTNPSRSLNGPQNIPSAAPMAVDPSSRIHFAFVRTQTSEATGRLHYALWNDLTASPNVQLMVDQPVVLPDSVDITTGPDQEPIIIYRTTSEEIRLLRMVKGVWVNYPLLGGIKGRSTKIVVEPGYDIMHIGYDNQSDNTLHYFSCPVPNN